VRKPFLLIALRASRFILCPHGELLVTTPWATLAPSFLFRDSRFGRADRHLLFPSLFQVHHARYPQQARTAAHSSGKQTLERKNVRPSVTEFTESTMQILCLMSADSSPLAFDLHCHVRETAHQIPVGQLSTISPYKARRGHAQCRCAANYPASRKQFGPRGAS
jgi:hypothetical protein